jgi:hypothetical protein
MQAGTNVPRRLEQRDSNEFVLIERKNMDNQIIERMFGRIGARVKIGDDVSRRHPAGIDIATDKRGEYFDIRVEPTDNVEYEVIDSQPALRHLLLMARRENGKQRFLCGHDERHWFVCAVPGQSVSNVKAAMEALQPTEVRISVRRRVKRIKNRLRRKNAAFVRQGEWFFVPVPQLAVNETLILRNEPLSRGFGSKAHMCQFLFRTGGHRVYVSWKYPNGLTEMQYKRLIASDWRARTLDWHTRFRDAEVYVTGQVRHPDHKTIVLPGWHRVLMNTEGLAPGARSVVFLD